MLSDKDTRNACSLSNPSNSAARGVPAQDTLGRTPFWFTMMKEFPSGNGRQDPKQADGNTSGQLAPYPQVLICPPPSNCHFAHRPLQSDYPANGGWRWQKEI
ncbi:hypothetical protein O181_100493 [Austropuccinia psidii MF-1]|uniref:Uncharacterized protein n=1 Tax=Austropuccinia psidii MF-1 TaxID=1389203 RepID=A0A9Q3PG68_9BASI|nr:hypothetical protein [Austropuccinia psidii MF-1]